MGVALILMGAIGVAGGVIACNIVRDSNNSDHRVMACLLYGAVMITIGSIMGIILPQIE